MFISLLRFGKQLFFREWRKNLITKLTMLKWKQHPWNDNLFPQYSCYLTFRDVIPRQVSWLHETHSGLDKNTENFPRTDFLRHIFFHKYLWLWILRWMLQKGLVQKILKHTGKTSNKNTYIWSILNSFFTGNVSLDVIC